MEFKPIKLPKFKKTDYTSWHRKFAFKPVYIDDRYFWLCNVYRRRELYRRPFDFKAYWNHIPYNDFSLLKQADLENSGRYESKEYDVDRRKSPVLDIFFMIFVSVMFCGMVYLAVTNSIDRGERRNQMITDIDNAKSLDELKTVVKTFIEFTK